MPEDGTQAGLSPRAIVAKDRPWSLGEAVDDVGHSSPPLSAGAIFVGALASGKGDLAARSAEILRAELGRAPA